MSMSTSYRYEVENPKSKALRKALLRQEQRIKNDEAMTEKEFGARTDNRINQIAQWVEGLEETSFKKKARRQADEIKGELIHANTQLTAVRRAQLRSLLLKEQQEYASELNSVEKTFHGQRT